MIAQLVGDLFALPGRKTQPLREKFQVKPEFLFGDGGFLAKAGIGSGACTWGGLLKALRRVAFVPESVTTEPGSAPVWEQGSAVEAPWASAAARPAASLSRHRIECRARRRHRGLSSG